MHTPYSVFFVGAILYDMYLVCYCLPAFLFFCTKKIKDRTTQHWVRGFRSERVRATQNSRSLIEAHPRVIPCTRLACREPHTQRSQVTHSSQKSSNFIQKNKVQRRAGRQLKIVDRQLYNYLTTRAHHNLTSAGTTRDSVSLPPPDNDAFSQK